MNFPQPRDPTPIKQERTPTPYIPHATMYMTRGQVLKAVRVTSSNPEFNVSVTGDSRSVVRVYVNKTLIAEERVHKRNPLAHLKTLKRSRHIESLRTQLIRYGITVGDIGLYDYKLEGEL